MDLDLLDICIKDNEELFIRKGWSVIDYVNEIVHTCESGHSNIARYLLDKVIDDQTFEGFWERVFTTAVGCNCLQMVKMLLEGPYTDQEVIENMATVVKDKDNLELYQTLSVYL